MADGLIQAEGLGAGRRLRAQEQCRPRAEEAGEKTGQMRARAEGAPTRPAMECDDLEPWVAAATVEMIAGKRPK